MARRPQRRVNRMRIILSARMTGIEKRSCRILMFSGAYYMILSSCARIHKKGMQFMFKEYSRSSSSSLIATLSAMTGLLHSPAIILLGAGVDRRLDICVDS